MFLELIKFKDSIKYKSDVYSRDGKMCKNCVITIVILFLNLINNKDYYTRKFKDHCSLLQNQVY